jgi:hypothetical protein
LGTGSPARQIDLSVPDDARAIDDPCSLAVGLAHGCITH